MVDSFSNFAFGHLTVLVAFVLLVFLAVWSFKICWNRAMTSVFNLKQIGLMDAAAILILIAIVSAVSRIALH